MLFAFSKFAFRIGSLLSQIGHPLTAAH